MQYDAPVFDINPNLLRRLCRKVMLNAPAIRLSEQTVALHDVHTNWISPGRVVAAHTHSFYEAHIVLEGKGTLATPEIRQVSQGTLLLVHPRTLHAWETREEHLLSLVLWFDLEEPDAPAVPLRWTISTQLLWVVRWLLAEAHEGEAGWPDRVNAFLTVLLSRILALTREAAGPALDTESDHRLETIVHHFMWDNLQRPLPVAEVAAHLGMSERNLYRKFHTATGETLMQRLQKLRIQRAQTLLEESDAPLPEIAQQVGIPDSAYFCRCFKRHTGTSPHRYRVYMRMG